MLEFPTSDPILAKQVTSKDFDGDIFELGLYVDVDSYRDKPFQKTIRYHLNLDDDYNLKKLTKKKTKFLVWGQEGNGKTTELKYLVNKLEEKGEYEIIYLEYPWYELPIFLGDRNIKIALLISLILKYKRFGRNILHFYNNTSLPLWEKLDSELTLDLSLNKSVLKILYKLSLNEIFWSDFDQIIKILFSEIRGLTSNKSEYLFIIDNFKFDSFDEDYLGVFSNIINENIILSFDTYFKSDFELGDIHSYQFSSFKHFKTFNNLVSQRLGKKYISREIGNEIYIQSGGNIQQFFEIINLSLIESLGNPVKEIHLNNALKKLSKRLLSIDIDFKVISNTDFLKGNGITTFFSKNIIILRDNYNFIINPVISKSINIANESGDLRRINSGFGGVTISFSKLIVQNFRGIKEVVIEEIPVKSNFIFILGENGYGKTSILQSIALGFLGDTDRNVIMIEEEERKNANICVEYYDADDMVSSLYNRQTKSERYFTAVLCYGSSRLSIQNSQSKNEVSEKSSNMYGLFYDDNTMLDIEYELSSRWEQTDNRFLQTQNLFKRLIPNLKEIKVNENKDIEYFEIDSSQPLKFNQLSAASKAHIALFGDLIIKFLKQYPETTDFANFEGIVIIDELELHLHPKWQRELPTLLAEIFPKVQFIVSTHSVFPILGAPKASVFIKVYRNDERGVWAEKIDIDPTNLTPNILFTSPLFDMDSILSVNNIDPTKVDTADDWDASENDREVIKALQTYQIEKNKFDDDLFK